MAEGIVLLAPADIPDPDPSFQRDGSIGTSSMAHTRGRGQDRLFADLRSTRRLGRKKQETARQRKRIRALRACQATLAVLRGENPTSDA